MSEKLIELYERCMKHNITISIKVCLSDACIEMQGDCLAYDKLNGMYEHIRTTRRISIEDMKMFTMDIYEYEIDELFFELLKERRRIQGELNE